MCINGNFFKLLFSPHVPSITDMIMDLSKSLSTTQGLPYDYKSVMHYRPTSYTFPTISPIDYKISIYMLGASDVPTSTDYLHINLLYCRGMHGNCNYCRYISFGWIHVIDYVQCKLKNLVTNGPVMFGCNRWLH